MQETANIKPDISEEHTHNADVGQKDKPHKDKDKAISWCKYRFHRANKLLWVCVILPAFIAIVYFGLIASDVYISESHFVVRSQQSQNAQMGLGALLQTVGLARAQDDTYMVSTYIQSRDVLPVLDEKLDLVQCFGNGDIDLFNRFNPLGLDSSMEALYVYLQKRIIVNVDMVSSISTLKIKAYSPQTAYVINESLLNMSENLVNQLNERAQRDTVGFAGKQVAEAEQRVKLAADNLYEFRLSNGIFDLGKHAEAQMQLISKLQDVLVTAQTQLAQIEALAPNNTQIPALKARERALQKEIQTQMLKIFGDDNTTITSNAAEYERLMLDHKLAEQQLMTAMASLENAKDETQRKQLYLERIAQPSMPDAPGEPHRLMNILATFVVGLLVYGVISLFVVSVKEHKD